MTTAALFEQVASNRGTLLRSEGEVDRARRFSVLRGLRLTFDLGIIEVSGPAGQLTAETQSTDVARGSFASLDEEEPWWKLLGQPLHRVVETAPDRLVLQWRDDADGPRRVEIRARAGLLYIGDVS